MPFDITKPFPTFDTEIDIPDKWSPEWLAQEIDEEPDIWILDKEPALKEFLSWANPAELFNLTQKTYETTPEMQEASNLAVLGQMGLSFLDAAGGGSSQRFMQWEQEARNRKISPMMYAEPVAAGIVIGLIGLWGASAALQLIQKHPKLAKMVKFLVRPSMPKTPVKPPGAVDVPFNVVVELPTGYPITRNLYKAVQHYTTIGELQKALVDIIPAAPKVIAELVVKSAEGIVTNQDIIKLVDKKDVFDVSTIFGLETDIIQHLDEKTGKVLSVSVEAPLVKGRELQEWELDKEIFLSYTQPKGDESYLLWQQLKTENELERAKVYRAKLQSIVDKGTVDEEEIDVARYALERIKKKMHARPPHSMFYDTTKGKEVEELPPKADVIPARVEGQPSDIITVTLPSGQKTNMGIAKPQMGVNPDYNKALYNIQDTQAEPIPPRMKNREYGMNLEGAGDIFREISNRYTPDPGYIQEKLDRVSRHPVETIVDIEAAKKHIAVYDSMELKTNRLKLVREYIRAVTAMDYTKAEILSKEIAESVKLTPKPEKGAPKEIEPIELNAQSYAPITPEIAPVDDYVSSVEFSKMLMEDTGVPAIKYDPILELPEPALGATIEGAAPLAGKPPIKILGSRLLGGEEFPIPIGGPSVLTTAPFTPRYTAHAKGAFTPEVTLSRDIGTKEMLKLLNNGLAETRTGLRFVTSWMRNALQDYQEKTGFPVYTEGHIPLMEAGFRDSTFRGANKTIIHQWRKELSPDELITLDWNMKLEQAIYEIETYIGSHPDIKESYRDELLNTALAYDEALAKLDPLNTTQIEIKQAYRVMLDKAFDYAGGDPDTYLPKYVSLMGEKKALDTIVDREFWGLYTKNYKPWFLKDRKSVGKVTSQYNIFDMAELYIDAAGYKHYLDDLKPVEELFNRLPGNANQPKSPKGKYLRWLSYLKTGNTESWLGEVPKATRRKLDSAMITVFGKALPDDFSLSRFLVQLTYFGTMSGNPSPMLKNLTQSSGNIGEMPVKYLIAGLKFIMTKEGWNLFQESGVLAGFSPYLQRQFGLNPTASTLRKVVYYGLEVPSRTGMLGFSGADTFNRHIWPAEYIRVLHWGEKYIKGEINWDMYTRKTDLEGMHPCVAQQVHGMLDSDKQLWEEFTSGISLPTDKPPLAYLNRIAHALATERTATHQHLYQKENRPYLGRQGGIGELMFQFMSWPIGKVEQQADILGAAQRLFKEGKPGPAFYQLWKEAKIIMFWGALALMATGAGIEGARLARTWGLGWLPTSWGPLEKASEEIYKSAVGIVTGYKWKSEPLGDSFKDLMGMFDPTAAYRSRYARVDPDDTAYQKTLKMLGFYIDKNEYGKDLYKEWMNSPITYNEWIRQQDFGKKGE